MRYVADVHTHSIVSGHAYSTLLENVKMAASKGIKVLGTSEHGPKMPGGPHIFYFSNIRTIPRIIDGVIILRGCEANIIDGEGSIDIPESIINKLDYVIASLHDVCIQPGNRDENTEALINAMESGKVHIMGHLGNPDFPIWEEKIVRKAKELDIIIEINNGSFGSRKGSEDSCSKIAKLCNEYRVSVILGSDSHICYTIGEFSLAEALIQKEKVDEKLILNLDEHRFVNYLKNKGKLMDLNLD